ncbi:MAG: hypothetical protein DWP92_08265, partial [Armatimonadetes bacterium]
DEVYVVDQAMRVRRASNGFNNFAKWIGTRIGGVTDIAVVATIDHEALDAILTEWDLTVIDEPAYDGAVVVVNGVPTAEYPQAGTRIDHDPAADLILAAISTGSDEAIVLPLIDIEPRVDDANVDQAVALAKTLVSDAIVLRPEGQTTPLVFSSAGLTTALRSEIVTHSPATVVPYLDEDVIEAIALMQSKVFEVPPVDASFTFDTETKEISVVPSKVGRMIDIEAIPSVVSKAALGSRSGTIPMIDGAQPALTTEMAEAMGPFGEVSTFTTHHPCCANRVVNIQLLADEINGHWVMPGEIFSINDTAGKRTTAEGYRRAGAIIGGEVVCCDSPVNVGGGTSQFATTFYNAVFFGCYEDIFHQPHSLYFSRYPFVREATLGFPAPDVKFRNDSDAVVYIETSYTPSSITVTLYGNNGGRTCESQRSGNTITRVMTHPDGSVTTQDWTWNYRSKKTTTTTTTKPPSSSTTTTTVPSSSTTSTSTSTTTTTTTATTTTTTTAATTTTVVD